MHAWFSDEVTSFENFSRDVTLNNDTALMIQSHYKAGIFKTHACF